MNNPKANILVVDDDPGIIEMVSDLLHEEKYNILVAPNGETAVNVATNEKPDIIIMDWEMPVMDGISALKALKQNQTTKNTPVIMITGRMTSINDLKAAFEAGAIDFIRKPIDPIELIARTRSMLLLSNYYRESVRKKDWELTLLSRTNTQNDRLLSEVTEMLDQMHKKCSMVDMFMYNELRDKIRKVRSSINNNAWEQFENYFRNVHPNFHENILSVHPKINPEELKLCYFLRLNMNSKEIAAITNREVNSVDIARYRLRKKLNLDRDVKLHEHLAQF